MVLACLSTSVHEVAVKTKTFTISNNLIKMMMTVIAIIIIIIMGGRIPLQQATAATSQSTVKPKYLDGAHCHIRTSDFVNIQLDNIYSHMILTLYDLL